ncbi:MAG: DUF6599 family protein [Acidobacteriota bacterium]
MKRLSVLLFNLIIALLFTQSFAVAQDNQNPAPQIVTIEPAKPAPAKPLAELLPARLAGIIATGEAKTFNAESLNQLVGDKAKIYQEYRTVAAASRAYGKVRVDIFQSDSPSAAFGAFTYQAGETLSQPVKSAIGANSLALGDSLIFWKQNYFVRIASLQPGRTAGASFNAVATEVAKNISADEASAERPTLFNSLPKNPAARSERYFLGGQSLGKYFPRASEIFIFDGDAEAAFAEYPLTVATPNQTTVGKLVGSQAKALQLVIVEYHTPQFAADADAQATSFVASLSAEAQQQLIVKRIGNFLVGATNFTDREQAEQLVGSIEYPYVVKWLQNPAIPTRDPFHEQKVAQMLLSIFSLIGLAGGLMMFGGLFFGTFVFLKRRKQNRESFSDAGGMLRLQLDPLEDIILGLPPKKE